MNQWVKAILPATLVAISAFPNFGTAWAAARLENFDNPERIYDGKYTVILKDGPQWQNHLNKNWNLTTGDEVKRTENRKAWLQARAADRVLLEAIAKEFAATYNGTIINVSEMTHDFTVQMSEASVRAMAEGDRIETISVNVPVHLSTLMASPEEHAQQPSGTRSAHSP
jgi:hypothetical protein